MTIHVSLIHLYIIMTSLNNYMSLDYCQRGSNIVARW